MQVDEFAERLARIRERFATTLNSKVDDSFACLPRMADKDAAAVETIIVVHRQLHEMCGIAPSIGFAATGKAARAAESVLREPAQTKRALTDEEIAALTAELNGLRSAAKSDLQLNPAQG